MPIILALEKVRKTVLKTSLSYTYIARSHLREYGRELALSDC